MSANVEMTGDMLVSLTPTASNMENNEAPRATSLKKLKVITHKTNCPHHYTKLARMLSIMLKRRTSLGYPLQKLVVSACLLAEETWDKAFFDTVSWVETVPCH